MRQILACDAAGSKYVMQMIIIMGVAQTAVLYIRIIACGMDLLTRNLRLGHALLLTKAKVSLRVWNCFACGNIIVLVQLAEKVLRKILLNESTTRTRNFPTPNNCFFNSKKGQKIRINDLLTSLNYKLFF